MKNFSVISVLVGFVFIALFLFFLRGTEGRQMTREKKKLTYQALEEHAVYWAVDQIEQLRDAVDCVNDDQSMPKKHKEIMFAGMADQLSDIMELLHPLRHEEQGLVTWVKEFINLHRLPDHETEN